MKEKIKKINYKIKKNFAKVLRARIEYFFIGGFLVFLLEWLFTIFLTETFLIPLRISYFISLVLGFSILYLFHKNLTFRVKISSTLKNYRRFILTYIFSSIANWSLVAVLTIKFNYIIIIPFISFLFGVLNYLLNRYWVFEVKEIK
jgi:putative flippase GtrA